MLTAKNATVLNGNHNLVPTRLGYSRVQFGQARAQAQIQSLMYCKFPFILDESVWAYDL